MVEGVGDVVAILVNPEWFPYYRFECLILITRGCRLKRFFHDILYFFLLEIVGGSRWNSGQDGKNE